MRSPKKTLDPVVGFTIATPAAWRRIQRRRAAALAASHGAVAVVVYLAMMR